MSTRSVGAAEAVQSVGPGEGSQPIAPPVPPPAVTGAAQPPLGPTGRPVPVWPEPEPVLEHGPARVIAVCNQKGGVGKTTTTINLGAALAGYGRRVLLVDFDPQASLSIGLGIRHWELDSTIYQLMLDSRITPDEVLLKSNIPGLDVLPSNIDLSAADMQLIQEVAREGFLQRALAPLVGDYDYILIDCQPSLGLLTINALTAADSVLIPLECEYFSLRGMTLILEAIRKVQARTNPRLEIEGVLATMYDGRTVHSRQVLELVVQQFGDQVFHAVIARTVRFPETTVAGEPITSYAPSSGGAVAYRELAREMLAAGTRRPSQAGSR